MARLASGGTASALAAASDTERAWCEAHRLNLSALLNVMETQNIMLGVCHKVGEWNYVVFCALVSCCRCLSACSFVTAEVWRPRRTSLWVLLVYPIKPHSTLNLLLTNMCCPHMRSFVHPSCTSKLHCQSILFPRWVSFWHKHMRNAPADRHAQ